MINKDKIVFNEPNYYVPTYSGASKVSIMKLKKESIALVKIYSKKKDFKPFVIPLTHIYNTERAANVGRREWEKYMRDRKKNRK